MNQPPSPYGPPPPPGQYGYGYPQQPPPPKKGMSGWAIAGIVLGSMFLLGIGSCVLCVGALGKAGREGAAAAARENSTTPAVTAATPSRPSAPPVVVTAKQLFADYKANEIAADEKYKDKNLLVSGPIQSIDKDAFNTMQVKLGVGDQFGFESVMASLDDSQKSKAMSLQKGKPIAVLCQGGTMIIGTPTLKDCVIE